MTDLMAMDTYDYSRIQVRAGSMVTKALKEGSLTRPDACEFCGKTPQPHVFRHNNGEMCSKPAIDAHHWRGYDHPLEVWWLCNVHHHRIAGREFHNGTVSWELAKLIAMTDDQKERLALKRMLSQLIKEYGVPEVSNLKATPEFHWRHLRALMTL